MVAVQTVKGKSIYSLHMHVENVPKCVIALLEIRRKFLSCMEFLAHLEIGFNPIVFEILAFL